MKQHFYSAVWRRVKKELSDLKEFGFSACLVVFRFQLSEGALKKKRG